MQPLVKVFLPATGPSLNATRIANAIVVHFSTAMSNVQVLTFRTVDSHPQQVFFDIRAKGFPDRKVAGRFDQFRAEMSSLVEEAYPGWNTRVRIELFDPVLVLEATASKL